MPPLRNRRVPRDSRIDVSAYNSDSRETEIRDVWNIRKVWEEREREREEFK